MGDRLDKADPYLDTGVRGHIVNVTREHYWKVASWFEFDDLIQEGYLAFAKCRARFVPDWGISDVWGCPLSPGRLIDANQNAHVSPTGDDMRRFMAYFQMAFNNRITDLQQHPRSKLKEVVYAALPDTQAESLEKLSEQTAELSDANLATLLANAPAEIAEMLKQILIDGAAEVPYLRTRLRKKFLPGSRIPRIVKGKRMTRETTAEHYDRCLGKTGVVSQLRNYFLGEPEDALIDKAVRCLFSQEKASEVCVIDNTSPE